MQRVLADWPRLIRRVFSEEAAFALALAILVVGVIVAILSWRWTRSLLARVGMPEVVEGTSFDRTARRFGTSTAGIIAVLTAMFVYAIVIIVALHVARLLDVELFAVRMTSYLPRLFIAVLAVIVGFIVGEKTKLLVGEKLRSVKLPEASLIPKLVKYSIFYIAALIALAQIGVATDALIVLLAAYAFGIVFLGGIAFKDLLRASAAGIYLLLTEPYSIGDEVRVDDKRGIVQEVDMFVTRIEADGQEYIVPNQRVFQSGIVRIRE